MARGRKLNSETINQIHELLRQKVPYSQIHERLGVSKGIISKIANIKSDSPAQKINNEHMMSLERTLNNEQSSPGLPSIYQPLLKISSGQSRKVNNERDEPIINFEYPSTPIDQKAHPTLNRQRVDDWLDIISDVIWNRGGKKAKLKELQQDFIELREQFTE